MQDEYIVLDTETSSLDPITTTIAGLCLYSPSVKPAYIPMNHISYVTNERSNGQVEEAFIIEKS